GVPVVPGVATASDVMAALDLGLDVLKLFPAEAGGGVATLKSLAGPFPGVRFVPTGGISAANAASYLTLPSVAAVGGSWMVAPQLVRSGDFEAVTRLAGEAVALVAEGRSSARATSVLRRSPGSTSYRSARLCSGSTPVRSVCARRSRSASGRAAVST